MIRKVIPAAVAALLAAGLALMSVPATAAPAAPAAAAPAASLHPLADCFGFPGVQAGHFDDYACKAPGNLYFWVTLDNGVLGINGDGVNAEWYKQHPDPGDFWVFETFTPNGSPRSNGRTVIIDVNPFSQCQVQFPSWSVTPTDCMDLTQGGQPGEIHGMTQQEQRSVNEFMENMRASIPLKDR